MTGQSDLSSCLSDFQWGLLKDLIEVLQVQLHFLAC
jgi:hypothetical protein